ncbi:TIGR04255 family protein [Dyella japonica]|uniref:TIGR04255 family protein n=1 Tax=Dyella japonica DSM 16301 TaxID=1440762 RepID=A0A0G9GZX2_9GAMM|nr:TIGR04255 family protein [Dyella japonica]KLD62499.1 hypothetical protein Y882_15725 [Dyella japonica DSM 16301]
MAKPRHLDHAPIREAIIDIQVTTADGSMRAVQSLVDSIAGGFSSRIDMWHNSVGLTIDPSGVASTQTAQSKIGVRLDAPPHVLQVKTTGLTFSRLAPYEDWDQICGEAKKYWDIYQKAVRPSEVTRVAVRYINSMPIPAPLKDFDAYLTCPPEVPPDLPQSISSFLQQTVIVDGASNQIARVTQALEHPPSVSVPMTILLDIDVMQQKSFDADGPAMWEALAKLRDFKNRIFFDYITEETAGYFV